MIEKLPKVIHVIETLGRGGAERQLVTLLPELVRQGLKVEVVVQRSPFELKEELEMEGIAVHILPKRNKWALYKTCRDLVKILIERNADIIHAHLYFPSIIVSIIRVLGFWTGTTFVTFHNLAYAGANKRTWKLILRQLLARLLLQRGIDCYQAVSESAAKHYKTAYGLTDVKVLYNAIDLDKLHCIKSDSCELIVLPGRLVPEKGHSDLINALAILKISKIQIIFAGDGPLRKVIEDELKDKNIEAKITGQLPYDEMITIISRAKLVVIPSHYEGFGLTALESMALGRPIVATSSGGLKEVLGDVGRFVKAAEPVMLAEAIRTALDDKDWMLEQQRKGPVRAQLFSVKKIAEQQIMLYQIAEKNKSKKV